MKHILVCVKAVPVSSSVEVDGQHRLKRDGASLQWNIADESALEAAFRLADKDGSVTVLTMGPPKLEDPLLELLARGANRAVLITDRLMAGADTRATARALASAAEKLGPFDAVFCGCKAIDGETGQVPGELAAALGNDPNFSTTVLNALAGKQPLDNTLTNLSGKDVAGLLTYLGLGEGSALPVGVPVPWPSATPPTGWLKCNGAAFSAEEYPELAKAYPTNKLPDLRGEFIRGWDDGRGVDSSRGLLTSQDHLFASHGHWFDKYYALTGFDPTGGRFVVTADAFGELITANSISTVSVGGSETRPRNVAFNYIVRAA